MNLWERCVSILKSELSANEYATWILPLQVQEQAGELRLLAPNQFVKDWVEAHLLGTIQEVCSAMNPSGAVSITLEIGTRNKRDGPETLLGAMRVANEASIGGRLEEGNINANFTFSAFVEGKSNQIARAASMQIAQNPGRAYNPLFIYGGVGLGKTHLMHAVGNKILETLPNARVVYLHSERFVADMVRALQHNRIDAFKRRYRSVNALLIDDVQFFAGKERSQEEFFHTFNALFESQQQIVLSSDRFPKEVSGLEERLRSRFGWGLTVAIEPPDLETRVAILQSKAHQFEVDLPTDVAFFVGQRIRSNIRELEGALRRLVANSQFTGAAITVDFAKGALRDMLAAQDKQVTVENIQKTVAEYYKIRAADLLSSKRSRSIARPRQVAMALAKELTKFSLPEIGNAFGGRDHTTVLHATRKIKELRESDPRMDEDFANLLRTLMS